MNTSLLPYPVQRQSWLKPGLQLTHMTRVCVCVLQAGEGCSGRRVQCMGSVKAGMFWSMDLLPTLRSDCRSQATLNENKEE